MSKEDETRSELRSVAQRKAMFEREAERNSQGSRPPIATTNVTKVMIIANYLHTQEEPKLPPTPSRQREPAAKEHPRLYHDDGKQPPIPSELAEPSPKEDSHVYYGNCLSHPYEEIRFLLVGKTGSGKSATGNTILGEGKFNKDINFSSVTVDCDLQRSQKNGMNIEVLDCPGLCDTRKTDVEVCTIIIQAIGGMHPGPHAVLFTTRLGRFTNEEYTVFKRLKEILDENVMKYLIVVFTGGDALEDEGKTFADLLIDAPQNLVDVLKQVNDKYIVFNNKAKNPQHQVNKLFDMVRDIIKRNNGAAYSCPKYALIGEKIEEEIEKRLKELEIRDLEQQNLDLELEAKAKAAEEQILQILRQKEEFAKKESDLENKIKAKKKELEEEQEDLLRKLELESQKHKEEEGEVKEVKLQMEMIKLQQEMVRMALSRQHDEERRQLQIEKETLERNERENEEIRKRKREKEVERLVQRHQVYRTELRKMRDEISIKANRGFLSSVFHEVTNVLKKFFGFEK